MLEIEHRALWRYLASPLPLRYTATLICMNIYLLSCTHEPRFIGVFRSMGELRGTEMSEDRHFPCTKSCLSLLLVASEHTCPVLGLLLPWRLRCMATERLDTRQVLYHWDIPPSSYIWTYTYMHGCSASMYVCMHGMYTCMPVAWGGQKRVLVPLKLDLQIIASHYVVSNLCPLEE